MSDFKNTSRRIGSLYIVIFTKYLIN